MAAVQARPSASDAGLETRTKAPAQSLFHSLGNFSFPEGTTGVTLDNTATDGYVIADAVRWIWSE